jgi:hypothetical protein
MLLFARMSTSAAYKGFVSTVSPTGGKVRDILNSGRGTIYESVSANDLEAPVIVLMRQYAVGERNLPQLFEGRFNSQAWRVVPGANGLQGPGFISPNNLNIVFSMATQDQPAQYSLWVSPLANGEVRKLTEPADGSWDASPSWRPDNTAVLFTRIRRSRTDGRLHVALMRVDLQTNTTTEVFGEQEGVVAGAYSPDGKEIAFWSKYGLEILNITTLNRTSALPGRQYYGGGGISWSRQGDILALPFLNGVTKMYELMTISRDGTSVKTVYSSQEFRIFSVTFVPTK